MIKSLSSISICLLLSVLLFAQKNERNYIFGHSLIHHEFQINPTPSQETSVPHWMHFLAQEAGHNYAVSGQYGFLPQHANLPPSAQWGFDFVPAAWDSENEDFSAANFTSVLLTPGNFIQWQNPDENYPSDDISPLSATKSIFTWCMEEEDSMVYYIYENWPDMGGFLTNGFPPSENEWDAYNAYLNADFHQWFLDYHDSLIMHFPNSCVRMIPVGPVISKLLQLEPFSEIPITEIYEDDAPHGRATLYFLASLTSYMAMYEEISPLSYSVESIIHPIIAENYEAVVNFIWDELNNFEDTEGSNRVFCSSIAAQLEEEANISPTVYPNPSSDELRIKGMHKGHLIEIYGFGGHKYLSMPNIMKEEVVIDIRNLEKGPYILILKDNQGSFLLQQKLIKH